MVAYKDAVLADSPTAFFEFKETSGGTVASSVNGYTATVKGGVTLGQAGPKGSQSAYFDGSTGYLEIQNLADFQAGNWSTGWTLEMWVKFDAQTMDYPTFLRRDGNGYTVLVRSRGPGSGDRVGDIETYNSGRSAYAYQTFANNQWHHVYVSSYGNTLRQWIDGTEVGVGYANGGASNGGPGTAAPTYIGRGAGSTEFFKGWIANVAIYPREIYNASAHYSADANSVPGGTPKALLSGQTSVLTLSGLQGPTLLVKSRPLSLMAGEAARLTFSGLNGPTINAVAAPGPAKAINAGSAGTLYLTELGSTLVLSGTVVWESTGQWFFEVVMADKSMDARNTTASLEVRNDQKRLRPELKTLVRA